MFELVAFETPAAPCRTLDPLVQPVYLAMETSLKEVGATARHCEETALAWQRGPGSRQTARSSGRAWIVRIGCSTHSQDIDGFSTLKVDPANHKFRHMVQVNTTSALPIFTKSSWCGSKSGRPHGCMASRSCGSLANVKDRASRNARV